jgi:hypothetical protein
MSVINVTVGNTFEEWRVKTNDISSAIGDMASMYTPPSGPQPTTVIEALDEISTRVVNKGSLYAMAIALG